MFGRFLKPENNVQQILVLNEVVSSLGKSSVKYHHSNIIVLTKFSPRFPELSQQGRCSQSQQGRCSVNIIP